MPLLKVSVAVPGEQGPELLRGPPLGPAGTAIKQLDGAGYCHHCPLKRPDHPGITRLLLFAVSSFLAA